MPQLMENLSMWDRRRIGAFVTLMLAITAFSFSQGGVLQNFMDLHLTAWPVVAVRNAFASVGVLIGIGFMKNWF